MKAELPLSLRFHHGMCLAFFEGKGYSDSFSAGMAQVRDALCPQTMVRLCCGPDAICARCPNLQGDACRCGAKVRRYDAAVRTRCGLAEGQLMPWGAFQSLVWTRILAAGERERICGDCEWNELCRASLKRLAPPPVFTEKNVL